MAHEELPSTRSFHRLRAPTNAGVAVFSVGSRVCRLRALAVGFVVLWWCLLERLMCGVVLGVLRSVWIECVIVLRVWMECSIISSVSCSARSARAPSQRLNIFSHPQTLSPILTPRSNGAPILHNTTNDVKNKTRSHGPGLACCLGHKRDRALGRVEVLVSSDRIPLEPCAETRQNNTPRRNPVRNPPFSTENPSQTAHSRANTRRARALAPCCISPLLLLPDYPRPSLRTAEREDAERRVVCFRSGACALDLHIGRVFERWGAWVSV